MVVLQLPQLAAVACAAAGSTAEPSTLGRVPWPPAIENLSRHLPMLHIQVCKRGGGGACVWLVWM